MFILSIEKNKAPKMEKEKAVTKKAKLIQYNALEANGKVNTPEK